MKRESLLAGLTSALLSFGIAWGAGGCLVTAFQLPMEGNLMAICLGLSLLSSILLLFRRGGVALLCLGALALGYLHRQGTASDQFWQLLRHLSTVYDRAYGWGVLVLPESIRPVAGYDLPVWIWCGAICAAVGRSLCRQKSSWLPMLVTLLPLGSCVVVTDTVPGEAWLLLVMAGLILLLLTSSVRRENRLQGLRLTAAAAIPVALALTGLLLAFPKETYVNQSEAFRENLLTTLQTIPRTWEARLRQLLAAGSQLSQKQVDLAHLGPRISLTYPILEITPERDGPLYLRQQDYDQYDGLGWTASAQRQEVFGPAEGPAETLRVLPLNRMDTRFLPYYPGEETVLVDGGLETPGPETEYTLLRQHLPEDWRQRAYAGNQASDGWEACRELPEETRLQARQLLEGLFDQDASNTEKADIIAAFVTNSAVYDLNPDRMPPSEQDFALWFLREGDRGYCVHFATAATVLLRAAGVPARYVTGYLAEGIAGAAVRVTEENAHAWAEYYEPNLDLWIPLEATPAQNTLLPEAATEPPETQPATMPAPLPTQPLPEETAAPQTETVPPSTEAALPEQPRETGGKFPLWLLWLVLPVPVLAAQRRIRLALGRRRRRAGDGNARALVLWQEAERLARLGKEEPPEELLQLAQKAKFSQHRMTEEELLPLTAYCRSCVVALRKKPWYRQLIYQYLYAVY